MKIVEIIGGIAILLLLKRWLAWSAPHESVLTVAEAWDWIRKEKGLQLIDVRMPEDFAQGHLPQARSLPLEDLGKRMRELDPAQPVLVTCRYGSRSTAALRVLLKAGYKAKLLSGGITRWQEAGYRLKS